MTAAIAGVCGGMNVGTSTAFPIGVRRRPSWGAVVDAIAALKAIGACALLIDSIAGVVGDGTHATVITDLSGNNRIVTLAAPPLFNAINWGGAQPAMRFVKATGHMFTAPLVLAAPGTCTIVMVADAFGVANGGLQGAAYRWDESGAHLGATQQTAGMEWIVADNSVAQATFTPANSGGKLVRTDVYDGVGNTRTICRNGTEQAFGMQNPQDHVSGVVFRVGASNSAVATPMDMTLAAVVVYAKALSATDRASVVALFRGRYAGIPAA